MILYNPQNFGVFLPLGEKRYGFRDEYTELFCSFIKLRLNLVFFIAISIVLCYPTNGTKIISFWELYFHRFAVNFGNVCLDRSTETERLLRRTFCAFRSLPEGAFYIAVFLGV